MPDDTPLANNMSVQLSVKHPGASYTVLRIRKPDKVDTVSLINKMLFGQPNAYREVPIKSYRFKADSIYIDEYIGDEDAPEKHAYNIFEVFTGKKTSYKNDSISYIKPGGVQMAVTSGEAIYKRIRDEIVNKQISRHTYYLGSDIYGRDVLSRIILGARVSLAVGFLAVMISLFIGVLIGAAAGYFGGWVDAALSWLMNILWSLPALLLVIAISFALGKGLWQIFVAVGLSMWVEVARLVRGQVMAVKKMEYVEAARALGYTNRRIIFKHILPNISGPVLVIAASNFASAILLESGLSFLGFGAQPPMPTWGGMIKEHYGYIVMDAAYLAIIPGLAIMLTVFAFNVLTTGLRDAFDIKSQNIRV
ncbi:ABC transporter permease [Mucilaginibacter roseus]|uniref:ABC transporter permease n=2 Tax=Mucilaginibacter roseus TaxID=1528868 RepID=A0ABS8U2P8_9SPHI|nr:ABC transporter permease [Mucilaginibacter roseus]MCD8741415.1 ABC transporter permease [Mucilaginibacter roseus]